MPLCEHFINRDLIVCMYTVVKEFLRYTVLKQQKLTPGGEAVFIKAIETLYHLPSQSSREEFVEIRSITLHKLYKLF